MARKIGAVILLISLLVVPFLDWRTGAVMWMSAWMIFILQKLFTRGNWKIRNNEKGEVGDDNDEDNDKADE